VSASLVQLLAQVANGKAEASLLDLFRILDLPLEESTLAKVGLVDSRIKDLGLELRPEITKGELDSGRRVIFAQPSAITQELVQSEIAARESHALELKSSLLFHHERAVRDMKATDEQLKSEEVLHASLKSVAAFLNSSGGVLYIGISDKGVPLGIEYDFRCMTSNPEKRTADQWELILRTHIKGKFKDGDTVNDYIDCAIVEFKGVLIARINVSARKKLCFLKEKDNGPFLLYRRQGNQTVQVTIDQVEEFLELRRNAQT
jgi:schlafen family protein